jgi:hypothetical protein
MTSLAAPVSTCNMSLTNHEYGEYSTRLTRLKKGSKGMLALGNQGMGIQELKFILQKSLLE